MIICDITKFWSERAGGVKTYLTEKSKYLGKRAGWRHILILPGAEESRECHGSTTIYRIRAPRLPWDNHYRFLINAAAVRRILKEESPDIIELGDPYVSPWLVAWGARGLPARRVAFFHSDLVETYMTPFLEAKMPLLVHMVERVGWGYLKFIYGQVEATFAASEKMKHKLLGAGVGNVGLVPLGVDGETFHPHSFSAELKRHLSLNHRYRTALYVGRLSAEKGVKWLLDHAKVLASEGVRLIMIGDGPLADVVKEASRQEPEHIAYAGFMGHSPALSAHYASTDFFLSPGRHETFGITLLEAMASGRPIVVPQKTPGAILASSGCGEAYASDDALSLRSAVRRVLCDQTKMGNLAREQAVNEYSWEKTFSRLCGYYEAVAATA